MLKYIFVSIFFAVAGLFIFANETRMIKKHHSFSIINLFSYMYSITYGFFPCVAILLYVFKSTDLSHPHYKVDYSSEGLTKILIWGAFSVLGYLALRTTYNLFFKNRFEKSVNESKPTIEYKEIEDGYNKLLGILQIAMLICFLISCVSLYLWLRAYGGFFGLIKIADKVRNGSTSVTNSLGFFLRPAKMIMIVVFMSFILIKSKYNVLLNKIIFIISFVLSILTLLGLDGRMALAMFLVTFILLAHQYFEIGNFSTKKAKLLVLYAAIAMFIMLSMDMVTYFIRNGQFKESAAESSTFIEDTLGEFSHILAGAQKSVSLLLNFETPYLIGHDILSGLFAWIPSSIRPDGIINVWNYNTELCTIVSTGTVPSDPTDLGLFATPRILGTTQLPCDFITTSLYDLGIFGPIFFGVFWGIVIKTIDYFHFSRKNKIYDIFYYALSMRVFRLVNYCLLYDFILGVFDIFLAFIILTLCKKIKTS